MQNSMNSGVSTGQIVLRSRLLLLGLAVVISPTIAHAEISTLGDVIATTPFMPGIPIDPLGNYDTGDLTIGSTDVGGLTMDVAFNPGAILTDAGIVGDAAGSFGRVSLDGFPSDWLIDTTLIIGNGGTGIIDLVDSAKVLVGDKSYTPGSFPSSATPSDILAAGVGVTTLGALPSGNGQLTLTNVASRLVTADLIVGGEGVGDIIAQSRSAIYSGDSIIGDLDGSSGTVTLSDAGTLWTVGDPNTSSTLTIGNGASITAATSAYGFLNINNQAIVQTTDVVTVNETGQINLSGGRLRDIDGSTMFNSGVIRGDGFIEAALDIDLTGSLRNAAATANDREYLQVSGAVFVDGSGDPNMPSGGLIESIGGEMEFMDLVTNDGLIVARDAIMRFRGSEVSGTTDDLELNGELILGGNSTIYGDILASGTLDPTMPGSNVTLLFDTVATFVGDVIFTESFFLVAAIGEGEGEGEVAALSTPSSSISITVGDTPSVMTVTGELALASDTVLELNYSSGSPSEVGESFQILSADNITGSFANVQAVADGRFWDVEVSGNEIVVTATDQLVTSADFDFDGDVDGFDFLEWQRGFGSTYGSNDLANWEANYGDQGETVAVVAAVPEPSTMLMAMTAMGLCYRRRKA